MFYMLVIDRMLNSAVKTAVVKIFPRLSECAKSARRNLMGLKLLSTVDRLIGQTLSQTNNLLKECSVLVRYGWFVDIDAFFRIIGAMHPWPDATQVRG